MQKYLSNSVATVQGHLNQKRQIQHPHKYPSQPQWNPATHKKLVFLTVMYAGKLYSNQTVHFPVTTRKGVKYLFIPNSYDTNEIMSETLNSRIGKEILNAYITCHDYIEERGLNTKIHLLDNKAFNDPKKYNQNHDVDLQLVLTGVHQRFKV